MSNYIKNNLLEIPKDEVPVGSPAIKIGDEIFPLVDGFQLVKVTNYCPTREGFTAPGTVTFSGLGTVESQWGDSADFSDVNGEYVITEDTKYKKGLARVYKQQDGKYYLCGYDPSDMDWAEYEAHWYVAETIGGYGYSAKMSCYGSSKIPSGVATWSNDMIGEFSATTSVAEETITSLTETTMAKSVTAFDDETAEWSEGGDVDISSYSITPQTNGIYFAQEGKLIGPPVDRELHIPEDGLVRRFKAVDGHFVDTIWGTEMMPYGDISFDELGYCGNTAAPFAGGSSYLESPNTLGFRDDVNYTFNAFFKPYSENGTVFCVGGDTNTHIAINLRQNGIFASIHGWAESNFIHGNEPELGKWHMVTIVRELVEEQYVYKFYLNGAYVGRKSFTLKHTYRLGNTTPLRLFIDYGLSSAFNGYIDNFCIWERCLTEEEIADMAKGLEGFNWDIPVKPYEQRQPVFYAPLTDTSKSCPTGQYIQLNNSTDLASSGFFRDGALWNYRTNDSGSLEYDWVYIRQNYSNLYTSGSFTVCVDVYVEGYRDGINWQNYAVETNIICSNAATMADGMKLFNKKGSSDLFMRFKHINGGAVPYNTWTTLIARSDSGKVDLFAGGAFGGQDGVSGPQPFSEYGYVSGPYNHLKCAIRNIRIYNRAITNAEIAELSGVKETE